MKVTMAIVGLIVFSIGISSAHADFKYKGGVMIGGKGLGGSFVGFRDLNRRSLRSDTYKYKLYVKQYSGIKPTVKVFKWTEVKYRKFDPKTAQLKPGRTVTYGNTPFKSALRR